MLAYGLAKNIYNSSDIIYNFTSLVEGYPRLSKLIPPNQVGKFTGYEFDVNYANYILENDEVFCQFFEIIFWLYRGKNVFLIISDDEWSENLIESLTKLIQQRYGYWSCQITSEDDYFHFSNIPFDFNISYGIANLDQDKERYSVLQEYYKSAAGINLFSEEEVGAYEQF